jgi:hypothetical protein
MVWGRYARTLAVAECPEGTVLTVTTTADELDGGVAVADPQQAGPQLSLTEALWIAYHRASSTTIRFRADLFPVDHPVTIRLGAFQRPKALEHTCIDGRDRGVVVEWDLAAGTTAGTNGTWPVGPGSLQVGLTLVNMTWPQAVEGQVAGCRLSAAPGVTADVLLTRAGVLGPGNVLARVSTGQLTDGVIRENYFGYDPLTRLHLTEDGLGYDVVLDAMFSNKVRVEKNVFTGLLLSPGGSMDLERNYVGVDRDGQTLLPEPRQGIIVTPAAVPFSVSIGPGNVIRGTDIAILAATSWSTALGTMKVTENSISGNARGIVYAVLPPEVGPTPPIISEHQGHQVFGTCPSDGIIEVFSDPRDQGETYLGTAPCVGRSWSLALATPPAAGRNLTATLTAGGWTSPFSPPYPVASGP